MSSTVVVAVIAAAAGLAGGLLTAAANRSVERLRARAAMQEKADERKLAALQRFMLAVNAWLDWLMFIEEQGWEGQLDELNARVRQRDDAYRQLILLCSEDLYTWLTETYRPLEYELKKTYVQAVRWGNKPTAEAVATRRSFSRLLREDMILQFRPEVFALRNPIEADRANNKG